MKKRTGLIMLLGLLLIAAGIVGVWMALSGVADGDDWVNSFSECAAAGNPIQESYPSVCVTSDGRAFENPAERRDFDAQD